jgi:hypothetical protein
MVWFATQPVNKATYPISVKRSGGGRRLVGELEEEDEFESAEKSLMVSLISESGGRRSKVRGWWQHLNLAL